MSEEKVIVLKPKRQDFEEIYFSGNQGSLFFSSTTRGKSITTIVVGLILLIMFFFKDDFTKEKLPGFMASVAFDLSRMDNENEDLLLCQLFIFALCGFSFSKH